MSKLRLAGQADAFNLFGLDLRAYWHGYRAGLRRALQSPALAWLVPDEAVRLYRADGARSVHDGRFPARELPGAAAVAQAVEVPEDLVLRQSMTLPLIGDERIARAVELRVLQLSPFEPADTVSGWRGGRVGADGQQQIAIAIASRRHLTDYLASIDALQSDPASVEVWVDPSDPIVIGGFGEEARRRRTRRRGMGVCVLLASAIVLSGLLFAVPVWQKMRQADEAEIALRRLQSSVAEEMDRKEQLALLSGRLHRLLAAEQRARPIAEVLGQITRAVPDDAVVRRLVIEGRKVQLVGLAADAAQLLQTLSRQEGFLNVRLPGAINRNALTGRESFMIEFELPEAVTR